MLLKRINIQSLLFALPFLFTNSIVTTSLFAQALMDHPVETSPQISLVQGLGSLHHPVTTNNPEAQRFFDQGLTFIYAFNHDAAYRSFKRASELDPQMAMAYWGMALALGPTINTPITPDREQKAYLHIQQALQLANRVTDHEQAYIQALSKRYSDQSNADLKQLDINYYQAMKKVMNQFPDDLDAATLFAESGLNLNPWNQWTLDGKPREGTLEIVKVLESVIKRDPNHLGANHYYIHAVEASKHPEWALMSANRIRYMLPASGHILHMPSHIYMLVGDYQAAAEANEAAVAADKAYIRQYGMEGYYPLHYMSHNLYFLSRAYDMEGRFSDSKKAADELNAFYTPHFQQMPELEYYQPTPLFVLIRFRHWNDILKVPPPNRDMAISTALWHFARALAYAALGEQQLAQNEQRAFQESWRNLPPHATFGNNPANKVLMIANAVLNAKLADAQHNLSAAIHYLQQAVAIQDTLRYNEPPDWFFPVRESLGGALLRNHQYQEAEHVFREDLNKHPRNGRALFGLLESLKAQSRYSDAYWVNEEFQKAWKNSHYPLTVEEL